MLTQPTPSVVGGGRSNARVPATDSAAARLVCRCGACRLGVMFVCLLQRAALEVSEFCGFLREGVETYVKVLLRTRGSRNFNARSHRVLGYFRALKTFRLPTPLPSKSTQRLRLDLPWGRHFVCTRGLFVCLQLWQERCVGLIKEESE